MNPEIIQSIQRSATVLEDAYREVFASAEPGMKADDIDAIIQKAVEAAGGIFSPSEITPFVVTEDGCGPKSRINRMPLAANQLWGMDYTINIKGFKADIGRYGYFGKPPENLLDSHQSILNRQDEIAAAIRPGIPLKEIYDAISPDGELFEVHAIGTEEDEEPVLGNLMLVVTETMEKCISKDRRFRAGQVICIELWCGLSGGIEDMYIVEENGLRKMTMLPRKIRILPLRNEFQS